MSLQATRPLLTLTMILKDEARTIARTLESTRAFVDRWCILDTGSTDGTQDVVRRCLGEVGPRLPGQVYEAPFVDFSTTRNHALDLCGDATEFILWLDADDVLVGGDALRTFLSAHRERTEADHEAYYVRVEVPGATFDSARILRSRSGWRFRGVVHEVLTHPDRPPPAHRVPGALVRHFEDAPSAGRSEKRWERDVVLLQKAVAADPNDTRAAFYLGMTLLWLGRNEEAMLAFDRRIALGGWKEEVFYAALSKARAAHRAQRSWPEVLALYLAAHSVAPHRAEPLYDIARYYDAVNDHALALLFARRGFELPIPEADSLFVEGDAYTWGCADLVGTHAYWVGAFDLGYGAAKQAAARRPTDARLARNVAYYEERLKG